MKFVCTQSNTVEQIVNSYSSSSRRIWADVYSSFEKGCRKKVQKCTRQSRKVLWVFSGNSEKMARDTMDVCLRVLRDTNKSRFDSYSARNVRCFETVFELKQHFLENCQAEISPATDTTFQIGYYAEGNKKSSISSEIHLAEAFSLVKNGKITLWVDPPKDVSRSSLGRKGKGRENNNHICTFCCWWDFQQMFNHNNFDYYFYYCY